MSEPQDKKQQESSQELSARTIRNMKNKARKKCNKLAAKQEVASKENVPQNHLDDGYWDEDGASLRDGAAWEEEEEEEDNIEYNEAFARCTLEDWRHPKIVHEMDFISTQSIDENVPKNFPLEEPSILTETGRRNLKKKSEPTQIESGDEEGQGSDEKGQESDEKGPQLLAKMMQEMDGKLQGTVWELQNHSEINIENAVSDLKEWSLNNFNSTRTSLSGAISDLKILCQNKFSSLHSKIHVIEEKVSSSLAAAGTTYSWSVRLSHNSTNLKMC
ncbi:predicted protein [Arabidopsis lyrata subsp. lyrata]|uniref:Predicted protein n=1 Tax=Arabidopsis lyrata subsp. lyrata TaxID=81972 RepID=D7LFF7_ARALL|nr:predicted protein [Arabidopsis lyrata subsp. lyrata]